MRKGTFKMRERGCQMRHFRAIAQDLAALLTGPWRGLSSGGDGGIGAPDFQNFFLWRRRLLLLLLRRRRLPLLQSRASAPFCCTVVPGP